MRKIFCKKTFIVIVLGLMQPTLTQADSIEISVLEDAYTFSTSSSNTGSSSLIASETSSRSGYYGSWMKFDISALIGMVASSAVLELTTLSNHSSTAIKHEVLSSSDDFWTESTISGLNQPLDETLVSIASTTIPAINDTYFWDVTSAINGAHGLAGENQFLSLFIRPEDYSVAVSRGPHIYSKESGGLSPRLVINGTTSISEPLSLSLFAMGLLGIAKWGKHKRMKLLN